MRAVIIRAIDQKTVQTSSVQTSSVQTSGAQISEGDFLAAAGFGDPAIQARSRRTGKSLFAQRSQGTITCAKSNPLDWNVVKIISSRAIRRRLVPITGSELLDHVRIDYNKM
jgi:hypothetical protein